MTLLAQKSHKKMTERLSLFFRNIKEGKIFFEVKQAVSLSVRHLFQDFQINKRLGQCVGKAWGLLRQTSPRCQSIYSPHVYRQSPFRPKNDESFLNSSALKRADCKAKGELSGAYRFLWSWWKFGSGTGQSILGSSVQIIFVSYCTFG